MLAGRQLPPHVREAVGEAALCGRLLTSRTHAVCHPAIRYEAAQTLYGRIAGANKQLAACNPGLIIGWADLPGLRKGER
ncbi:hypothetical protein ADK57_25875 [Streptomyces sp. MMG1533]|nr:hypothetical protein ADK57_25875 [Streptomyces sp. MMG1533]